jgi:putative DNA primase/helicase
MTLSHHYTTLQFVRQIMPITSEKRNLMYVSNSPTNFVDPETKKARTEVLDRLYDMEFNLIPVNGKNPPCIEWKPYQNQRVSPEEIKEWMRGRFSSKDGKSIWRAENLNFALVTGSTPWSKRNPGTVVIDTDDDEAEELASRYCPDSPMKQITGSGGVHRIYRRPATELYIPNRQKTWMGGKQYNVDLRADGGYIMCPGSIHPRTGKLYEEVTPWTLELLLKCPIFDPSWLPCEKASVPSKKTVVSVPANIASTDHADLINKICTSVEEREEMARKYLESVPGTQQGDGADRRCTALTMKLLFGFALPVEIVQEMLSEWGQKADQLDDAGGWYPWTEQEIARKIEWCCGQEYRSEIGDKLHAICDLENLDSNLDDVIEPFECVPDANPIDPKDQLEVAEHFLRQCFTAENSGTLIHQQSTWHVWNGKRYEITTDDDIKAKLWKWLSGCSYFRKGKQERFQPTRNIVSGVMDALKAVANQSSTLESPCWLTSGPLQVIAFDNGLLDVDELLTSGKAELARHTPQWFSPNCLPHRFDACAECSTWLAFLNEVFDGDEERIATLRQWFGYNLIADNRHHKMALLIGPPRSGKGTTLAIMSAMLGKHNISNSSLAALGGRFGLEPLVGRLAAIIDEGHLGKFSDTSLILERLKAISGGSEQSVDRKGVAALSSVAIKVRFTLAVNELPRLSDSSAAMRSRLLVIPFFNSYEGKEDVGLVDRLLTEIPGITNWALSGLRTLNAEGRFNNPTAGEKILRDFVYLSSPVQAFLDECCEVDSEKEVKRNDLQLAWQIWCNDNGHVSGSHSDFGRKLRAVVARIDDIQRRTNGQRERWYSGVCLTPEARTDITRRRNGV